jgi:zinc protease
MTSRTVRGALLPLLLLSFLSGAHAAETAAQNTFEHKLANGLRVIVKEDHRAPTVVSMVWYKAGSMDEFNGTTGVAHVLEHMMFKGTKQVPVGQFSKLIAEAGGRDNAFTNRDYTAYFQQLQKSKLELSFKLEADRMQNLALSEAEFAKEIKVVMEERRLRTDDQPQSLLFEQLTATAFDAHPYRVPVIGWMNDLEHMTYLDARAWYDRWYAPNNAVVVVSGDVKASDVFALAQKYFGPLKPKTLPLRKPQDEPPQTGIRRITVKAPAELPLVAMAYRAPVLRDVDKDWEPYALEVLAEILDGNDAARLNRALVREQRIANSVSVSYDDTQRGPALFILTGAPNAGKTAADIEQGLRSEIAKVVADGVSETELKRVKSQVVASQVFQRDSMFFQAMQIGQLEITGYPYSSIDLMLKKLQQVTAAQVQEVAKKYLIDDGLTVAVLDPQPLNGRQPAPPMQGMEHVR